MRITALVYIEFFEKEKLEHGGIIEGYTTQPFHNYIGVNVPIKMIDGTLGPDTGRVQIRVPHQGTT